MKQTSFAALSLDERNAVIDALRRGGVATRQVCVSRSKGSEDPSAWADGAAVTLVTTAHSCFSYHRSAAQGTGERDCAASVPAQMP